ncbi:hypothetical protein E4N62_17345 [Streptomyces sp. MNU76]|uniref:hypothetical protein n=1 Tax=Streptomyces sp. MNU76 TaxID=2560026 RepID=UPI001E4CEB74|nr:hypothetical protein [Streptomyces sp. MNU76]MCC9706878.1 hypothetical protein [Streptomyces sp. MNU76]
MTMSIDSTPAPAPAPTTLGEEILLLSLDDTTGEARLPLRTPYAIAAASLLERTLSGAGDAVEGAEGAEGPVGRAGWACRTTSGSGSTSTARRSTRQRCGVSWTRD